jgi:vanillate O-demethylase ferredoxin subunit
VRPLCAGIVELELVPGGGQAWPPVEPGAHIDLFLSNGLVRQYSLCNEAGESDRYLVAVQRELAGRGGSAWIHEHLKAGDRVAIGGPRNHFVLLPARRHLLIAGGIGITPIRAMARHLAGQGGDWKLHYVTRSPERTAYLQELRSAPFAARAQVLHDGGDPARGLDLDQTIGRWDGATRLYCCGPTPLMDAVGATARRLGWAEDHLHFEHFKPVEHTAEAGGDRPFTVRLARSGRELLVPAGRTLLEVLEDAGCAVDCLCREGICGTCETRVLEGAPEHRDSVLSEAERAGGRAMMVCVSRARGEKLVLDL